MTAGKRYAEVIGDPIAQSKSPAIHGFWLEQLGIDADYRACHVKPDDLADYVVERRADPDWRGCNITIPHKIAAMAHADRVAPEAKAVGATNCLYRADNGDLVATNTDCAGIEEALGSGLNGCKRAVLVGSGGAARAALHVLTSAGINDIALLSRDPDRAIAGLGDHGAVLTGYRLDAAKAALRDADLLINASPMGMAGKPDMAPTLLESVGRMAPNGLAFDMVYAPLDTALLQSARAAGLATADGLIMLIGQAAKAFELFFGAPPPRDLDAQMRDMVLS